MQTNRERTLSYKEDQSPTERWSTSVSVRAVSTNLDRSGKPVIRRSSRTDEKGDEVNDRQHVRETGQYPDPNRNRARHRRLYNREHGDVSHEPGNHDLGNIPQQRTRKTEVSTLSHGHHDKAANSLTDGRLMAPRFKPGTAPGFVDSLT